MSEQLQGLLILAAIPLVLVVVFAVVVLRSTRAVRLGPDPDGVVQVWARLGRPTAGGWGGTADDGRLALTPSALVWTPRSGQVWQAAYGDVVIEEIHPAGPMSFARIDLRVGQTGVWQLVVSDEPIRTTNDFQRTRHAAVAREVCDLMRRRGARVRPDPRPGSIVPSGTGWGGPERSMIPASGAESTLPRRLTSIRRRSPGSWSALPTGTA